jgi:hypothetical protein
VEFAPFEPDQYFF